MKTTTIIILLLCAVAYAGQTFTIPAGVTNYGPIAVNPSIQRYANLEIERSLWTDPNIKMTALIEVSIDGGKTYSKLCGFTSQGSTDTKIKTIPTSINCPFPKNSTHLRGNANVTGGSITITKLPSFGGKP